MNLMLLRLVMIGSAVAQEPEPGKCPEVEVKPNFQASRYLGKWYEAVRSRFDHTETYGKCVYTKYWSGEDRINFMTRQISNQTEKEDTKEGYALQNPSVPSKWTLIFPFLPEFEGLYWILDTDYKSYSVVWSCHDHPNNQSVRLVWILTRERFPPRSIVDRAYDILDETNTNRQSLIETDQVHCPEDDRYEVIVVP